MSRDPAPIALNAVRMGSPAPEPGPALNHVSQGIGRHRVAQLRSRSDNVFELPPAAGSRHGLFKRRAVPFCLEKRRSKGPEGVQGIVQYCPRILKAFIAAPHRTPEGLADDPVMGLDHGIGDSAAPLHGTDGGHRQRGWRDVDHPKCRATRL